MLTYQDLYEILRKEKYSEPLQPIPKDFIKEVSQYLSERKVEASKEGDLFTDNISKAKKQLENSISLFKELILRRKKKILNLVFVAAETGIMKRDFETLLSFEKDTFEKLIKAFEDADKELARSLNGTDKKAEEKNRMIMFNQEVSQFIDMSGKAIGPFIAGELANLDSQVSEILVTSGKATFVDED